MADVNKLSHSTNIEEISKESGLPKIPIEEKMMIAMEHPEDYGSTYLGELWEEYQEYLSKLKADRKEIKAKDKILKRFEKAVDKEYAATWKTTLKVFGTKIKNIKIKKHKE